MKSFEQRLSEKCPAVAAWHKMIWEQQNPVEVDPIEEECVVTEEVTPEPEPIKEWRTVHGQRRINNNFAKNMTVGY